MQASTFTLKQSTSSTLYIILAVQCDELWLKRGVRSYNSILFSYGLVYNILGIKGESPVCPLTKLLLHSNLKSSRTKKSLPE